MMIRKIRGRLIYFKTRQDFPVLRLVVYLLSSILIKQIRQITDSFKMAKNQNRMVKILLNLRKTKKNFKKLRVHNQMKKSNQINCLTLVKEWNTRRSLSVAFHYFIPKKLTTRSNSQRQRKQRFPQQIADVCARCPSSNNFLRHSYLSLILLRIPP